MELTEANTSRRVRVLLAEHEISASELARRLGWKQSYIARRMRGDVDWRAGDLTLIAREFGVDISALVPTAAVA